MTVNPSSTRELSIETIIQRAYQLAGLMGDGESTSSPAYAGKRSVALDFLDTICKDLQAGAVISLHVSRTSLAFTATQSLGVPDTSLLSVIGDGMWLETGGDIETPVKQIDHATYMAIADKAQAGTPTTFFVNRRVTGAFVYVWPVPTTAGALWFRQHRLVADASLPQYTLDLERHWTKYILWELAHWLGKSNSVPLPECAYMAKQARDALEKATGYSKPAVPFQMKLSHRTRWR